MKLFIALAIAFVSLNADIQKGEEIYTQNCGNCHRTDMKGGMGKDFNIVSYNRKREDIIKYITDPSKMYREFGYSANAMPELPLSEDEIKDVAHYIDSLQTFKIWMKIKS